MPMIYDAIVSSSLGLLKLETKDCRAKDMDTTTDIAEILF
jgi:hypothetical protein